MKYRQIKDKEEISRIASIMMASDPIETDANFHVHEETYLIDGIHYRWLTALSGDEYYPTKDSYIEKEVTNRKEYPEW